MPLIRGTIKPTPELWTPVWLSLPSCDFWTAWSAMQPSSVTLPCLHRVWFAFINVWHCQKMDEMCCMVFMLQIPLSPWPKTQPALSPIPRIWHVWNTKTVLNWAQNCDQTPVSKTTKWFSTHGPKSLDSIPPTQHANVHWWSLLSQRC